MTISLNPAPSTARHILAVLASALLLLDTPTAHSAATALPALPGPVPARQFILIDQANGRTLAAQDAERRAEPASITKLMTIFWMCCKQ